MSLESASRSLGEVTAYLDELLQVAGLDESSNGLVIEGNPNVDKVGFAVNCSWQAIEGATQRGCGLLVTHHALLTSTDAYLMKRKQDRLRELGLSLYVAHECLDTARDFGTADALARGTQIAMQGPFAPDGEQPFGVHGITTGDLAEFVVRVGVRLGAEVRRWKNSASFGHIAIVPGWGGRPEWMAAAQSVGCDTYLTGEALMFGMLFARESGMNLVLAGHYASETPGVLALSARMARDLALDVTFIPEELLEVKG